MENGAEQEHLEPVISSATYDSISVPIGMADHMDSGSCRLNNVPRAQDHQFNSI